MTFVFCTRVNQSFMDGGSVERHLRGTHMLAAVIKCIAREQKYAGVGFVEWWNRNWAGVNSSEYVVI